MENWKEEGLGGVNEDRKDHGDWGRSEMVVNSCLEDPEGRMRLKKMWNLIP